MKHMLSEKQSNLLLKWFFAAVMWSRYSVSVETTLDVDLSIIKNNDIYIEKMMDNILRMGILDVFVAEGKEQEIVLNYQSLDEDVSAYQRSISAGSWIGFSLFFLLIMLISWGVA